MLKQKLDTGLRYLFVVVFSILAINAYAAEDADSPHAFVKKTADGLVGALNAQSESLKKNPDGYKKIVNDHMVPAVDFETLSKFVMGKKYYMAATPEQREKFIKVFKDSLVDTYSTGLSIFDSQEITVLPDDGENAGKPMQAVKMEVKTAEGTIFPLNFTMKKHDDGSWKVVNVILNGVNVAKAYNSHFSETMLKNGENMDNLIANWNAKIEVDAKPTATAQN